MTSFASAIFWQFLVKESALLNSTLNRTSSPSRGLPVDQLIHSMNIITVNFLFVLDLHNKQRSAIQSLVIKPWNGQGKHMICISTVSSSTLTSEPFISFSLKCFPYGGPRIGQNPTCC